MGWDSNYEKLTLTSDGFPRIKEVMSSHLGTLVFLGGGLPVIEAVYRANPDALTEDLLFAACICGYPAPGVVPFLARQKPEEIVINNMFDIESFGKDPEGYNISYEFTTHWHHFRKVTLLQAMMYREILQPGAMDQMEDDIKAIVDIWPEAVVERDFTKPRDMCPCVASMHLVAPFGNNLIRYMSEKLPRNLEMFELTHTMFEDGSMVHPGIRKQGIDDDCMIMVGKVLHLPNLKEFRSDCYVWRQDAYVSFVKQVLQCSNLTTLSLTYPALGPSPNQDSLKAIFKSLRSTAAQLCSQINVTDVTIDYGAYYLFLYKAMSRRHSWTGAVDWVGEMTSIQTLKVCSFDDISRCLPLVTQVLDNINNQAPSYHSSLQSLTIDHKGTQYRESEKTIGGLSSLLISIKGNKTLEKLVLSHLNGVEKVIYTDVLSRCVMMHNTSLKEVILHTNEISNGHWSPACQCHSCDKSSKAIQYYTLLNRCGRGSLTSVPILVEMLANVEDVVRDYGSERDSIKIYEDLFRQSINGWVERCTASVYYELLQCSINLWVGSLIP